MSPVLGSRKRFLYRVLVYGATPLLGLFVFLDNPNDLRGRVIGGLAILAGAVSLVLLITRLRDPWGAIRYAVRPVPMLKAVLASWPRQQGTDDGDLVPSLHAHLNQKFPDLAIGVGDPQDDAVLTLGEEVTVIPTVPPQTAAEREGLLERLEALHSPLESRAIVLVLATSHAAAATHEANLSELNRTRGVYVVRV
ncbi:MAG: hypothetical protein ABEK03_00410 [Candidatus Bipolaricaulia bacterium]